MAADRLEDVYRRALRDPAFWGALRANPAKTVAEAGFTLSRKNVRALKEALSKERLAVGLREFVKGHESSPSSRGAWRSRWPGRWIGRWIGRWPGRWIP